MNIAFITSSFPRNHQDPAGIFIYHLAKCIGEKGFKVSVIAPHDQGCALFEHMDNVHIHRFPYFFPFNLQKLCYGTGIVKNINHRKALCIQIPFFLFSEFLAVLFFSKRLKADIIHSHWSIPQGLISVIASKLINIPCVTTVHGSDVNSLQHPISRAVNRWVFHRSDICTANSTSTADTVTRISGRTDIVKIPMGVDTDGFINVGKDKDILKKLNIKNKVILFAGRLIDLKGLNYLIQAMALIVPVFPDIKLLIVGAGPDRKEMGRLVCDMGINENTVFLGNIPHQEMKKYYSLADVFVLPSIVNDQGEMEGLGVVLLEAMSCGVPVIGSDIGGISDIIRHEKTGLLVPQKNPKSIAEGIIRIIENDLLQKTITDNAKKWIKQNYSWDIISDHFIRIYTHLLQRKTSGG